MVYSSGMRKNPQLRLRRRLFLLLMICFAAAILGDSTAEALLLAQAGPSLIPWMFIVNAGALFLLSAGLLSVVDRIDRWMFFFRALPVHAAVLVVLRLLLETEWGFLYPVLFSYAYGTKILFFFLFWTMCNDLIDSRRAAKEFPVIAAGGTIGAIGVSFMIPVLMRATAVENLLLVVALLIVAATTALLPLRGECRLHARKSFARERRQKAQDKPRVSTFSLLREEPLLRSMSILYFLVFFLLLNQHYLFYREVNFAFSNAGDIAGFLGKFNGLGMSSTFLLQVCVAGTLLRRLGSTRSMLLLPVALMAAFGAMLIVSWRFGIGSPQFFWVVVAGMGVRIAFFDAFFSPNFQLFFSGLARDVRGRGKLLIEGAIKPAAMLASGFFLLRIIAQLSLRMHVWIMVAMATAALIETIRLKGAYSKTLTRFLVGGSARKPAELFDRFDFGGNDDILLSLVGLLDWEDFEIRKFVVEVIASVGTDRSARVLCERLDRADCRLRATIVLALGNFRSGFVEKTLFSSLYDSDNRVVANAVEALARGDVQRCRSAIEPLLEHQNHRVRANTIIALWPAVGEEERSHLRGMVRDMVYDISCEVCAAGLYVTGVVADEQLSGLLFEYCRAEMHRGLKTESIQLRSVKALEKKGGVEALEIILQIGKKSFRRLRPTIIGATGSMLSNMEEAAWCAILERGGNALFCNYLLLGARHAGLSPSLYAASVLNRVAFRELEAIDRDRHAMQILSSSGSGRMALLFCAIREELVSIRIDTLLNIVALIDRSGVVASIIPFMNHPEPHVRARALEVLENSKDVRINRGIINICEWLDSLQLRLDGSHAAVKSREIRAAAPYCASHNDWVALCAEYACETSA